MADGIPQAERSRRWRAGIAQRLEVIQAELRELGDQISRELAVVTDKLAEQERRAGRPGSRCSRRLQTRCRPTDVGLHFV